MAGHEKNGITAFSSVKAKSRLHTRVVEVLFVMLHPRKEIVTTPVDIIRTPEFRKN